MTPILMELVRLLVPVILGGGLLGAYVSYYTARQKVPRQADSLIVSGAETAVATLERSLAAETRRADRAERLAASLEEAIERKDARINALEARLDTMQAMLDDARSELHAIIAMPDKEFPT